EGGIRDLTVTGVQTCALPISSDGSSRAALSYAAVADLASPAVSLALPSRTLRFSERSHDQASARARAGTNSIASASVAASVFMRSEERRVGKECRLSVVRHP